MNFEKLIIIEHPVSKLTESYTIKKKSTNDYLTIPPSDEMIESMSKLLEQTINQNRND